MPQTHIRTDIQRALNQFTNGELHENATHFLKVLGYESQRTLNRDTNTTEAFREDFDPDNLINPEKAHLHEWQTADFLFQLTADEIRQHTQEAFTFNEGPGVDESIYQSYLFLAIKLKGDTYSRTALANITREINKLYAIPALLIFQHGHALTFSIINRRPSQRDAALDVLEKVTLIKDIDVANPHRAHLDILAELSLDALYQQHGFTNFLELHQAWQQTLDTSELNRRFFKEIADWYFWAVEKVTFPPNKGGQGGSADAGDDADVRNATCIIRLITRLIFVWFLKEKHLVPDALFDADEIAELLTTVDAEESTYYKAILQNLFFATLNQEMNPPDKGGRGVHRKFRGEGRQHYNITSLYRYKRYFKDPEAALHLFESIPFLNGGLFECLDKPDSDDAKTILRIDGFSDREDNPLCVPNELFFSEPQSVNLNAVYGTKNKKYVVRGLIHILNRYKFTIAENTPIEEEVALDPELLGQVFENLLAAYNPETGTTARKQTGSFYTPREVVNYMVDESLIAYLKNALAASVSPTDKGVRGVHSSPTDKGGRGVSSKLRHLLSYNDEPHQFTDTETEHLINAIDTLKILDPACGSGAFPMGILHKLVFLLSKLDPRNAQWRQRQIDRVQAAITVSEKIDDSTFRESAIAELEGEIESINEAFERNELDYGRKLYLVENCIYGVDIQPIATQIAKLRFFISLIVEQRIDDTRENRGVRPLPNLETKFVAADTLLDVEKPEQLQLRNPEIDKKEKALEEVRRRYFTARTPRTKERYRKEDAELRAEISALLKQDGFPDETTQKIAQWDLYDQNASADFFDAEWMFGIREGFDVVIGNPPYINIENLPVATKDYLFKNYQTCKGRTDIYIAFLEKSISILNANGVMSFILPSAFATQKYGEKMREVLIKNHTIREVVDASSYRIFENAVVYNIVLTVGSHKDQEQTKIRLHYSNTDFDTRGGQEFFIDQRAFGELKDSRLETNPLVFDSLKVKEKVWQDAVRFDQICLVSYGARLNHRSKKLGKDHYVSQSPISGSKQFCEGKNIERYAFSQAGWLDYTPNEHYNPMFPELFENKKLMFIRIVKDRLRFAYDDDGFYNSHTVVNCLRLDLLSDASHVSARRAVRNADGDLAKTYDYKFLLGILNSGFINWYFRNFLSDGLNFYPNDAKALPIPNVNAEQQAPIVERVDQILAAKAADPHADTAALEKEIDKRVYALYNLTKEDIVIVEATE